MPRSVVLVNPQSTQFRRERRKLERLKSVCHGHAHVIDCEGPEKMLQELDQVAATGRLKFLFVAGGDHLFHRALNWSIQLPRHKRPYLISPGGGQFTYVCKFQGFPHNDPVYNLNDLFIGKMQLRGYHDWQPIRIDDYTMQKTHYAALVANGVICDVIEWYEQYGKGGIHKVAAIIGGSILSVLSDTIRRWHGRLKPVHGSLELGDVVSPTDQHLAFMFSSLPELVTWCTPFQGVRAPNHFFAAAYWGGYKRLASMTPFIWMGHTAPWAADTLFNKPIEQATVTMTTDNRLVLDGDVERLPQRDGVHRLGFSVDEKVPLGLVVRSR